jgi:hypothetical protein
MTFLELYNFANGLPGSEISVQLLAKHVSAHHAEVGKVEFWPVDLDPAISLGHMIYEDDRDSAYEPEYRIANIRFHKGLNRCWRRFVCCKELMHVFDDENQRANTREKFLALLEQLETTPLPGARSPMYESEIRAMWMAILVLCPEAVRAKYQADWEAKIITDYDVASELRIPEAYVKAMMGPTYSAVKAMMLGQGADS